MKAAAIVEGVPLSLSLSLWLLLDRQLSLSTRDEALWMGIIVRQTRTNAAGAGRGARKGNRGDGRAAIQGESGGAHSSSYPLTHSHTHTHTYACALTRDGRTRTRVHTHGATQCPRQRSSHDTYVAHQWKRHPRTQSHRRHTHTHTHTVTHTHTHTHKRATRTSLRLRSAPSHRFVCPQ